VPYPRKEIVVQVILKLRVAEDYLEVRELRSVVDTVSVSIEIECEIVQHSLV
jgi:hypothetical protein